MSHNRFPGAKYANIFSYKRTNISDGYEDLDEQTLMLVKEIPGYLGYENIKDSSGRSIFISYWDSKKAIDLWRKNAVHKMAKDKSKTWYSAYHTMLVHIEYSNEYNSQQL